MLQRIELGIELVDGTDLINRFRSKIVAQSRGHVKRVVRASWFDEHL